MLQCVAVCYQTRGSPALTASPRSGIILQCNTVCCSEWQCAAKHCKTLQNTAKHCKTLCCKTFQHTATNYATTHCNTLLEPHTGTALMSSLSLRTVLQYVAVCCSMLQCASVCCSAWQYDMTHMHKSHRVQTFLTIYCNTLQHAATHCNTPQHTATEPHAGPGKNSSNSSICKL